MAGEMISADSHVVESPDLWEKWLPKEFLSKAPKLVKDAEGGDAWQYRPGTPPVPLGLVTTYPGRTYEQFKWTGARYDKINQGAFIGAERVKEQKIDGVDAEVLYPSQRTMRHFMLDDDNEFHKAGIQAYNNWMAKEFMAADPQRLIGLAQMPNLGRRGDDRRDAACQDAGDARRDPVDAGRAAPPRRRSRTTPSGRSARSSTCP